MELRHFEKGEHAVLFRLLTKESRLIHASRGCLKLFIIQFHSELELNLVKSFILKHFKKKKEDVLNQKETISLSPEREEYRKVPLGVLTAATKKSSVFWDVTLYSP
jgi:hypothetical protein